VRSSSGNELSVRTASMASRTLVASLLVEDGSLLNVFRAWFSGDGVCCSWAVGGAGSRSPGVGSAA